MRSHGHVAALHLLLLSLHTLRANPANHAITFAGLWAQAESPTHVRGVQSVSTTRGTHGHEAGPGTRISVVTSYHNRKCLSMSHSIGNQVKWPWLGGRGEEHTGCWLTLCLKPVLIQLYKAIKSPFALAFKDKHRWVLGAGCCSECPLPMRTAWDWPALQAAHPSTWSQMPCCSQSSFRRPILSVCPTAAVPTTKYTGALKSNPVPSESSQLQHLHRREAVKSYLEVFLVGYLKSTLASWFV